MSPTRCYINILVILASVAYVCYLISGSGLSIQLLHFDIPLILFCVGVSFLIHWVAFIPAFIYKTERFFDLVGSITNTSVICLALYYKLDSIDFSLDIRSIVICVAVVVWAVRLGVFLFSRIIADGKDRRFDEIKLSFSQSLMTWTLSAFWVSITTLAAVTSISSVDIYEIDVFLYTGLMLWLLGLLIEITADHQKRKFKADLSNRDKFISTGLWSVSRHPNYVGEITLWVGVFVMAVPTLVGIQFIVAISPLFVYLLLTRISGVNLLEKIADEKWGHLESYAKYKSDTPVLFPFLRGR